MYLNSSFANVVLSTLDEHHHEEDPGFSTKNYHWTVQQEKVPHSYANYHLRNFQDGGRGSTYNASLGWFRKSKSCQKHLQLFTGLQNYALMTVRTEKTMKN